MSGYPDTAQRQTSDTSPKTQWVRNIKAPNPNATKSHPGPDTFESWGSVCDFDGGPDWEMDIIYPVYTLSSVATTAMRRMALLLVTSDQIGFTVMYEMRSVSNRNKPKIRPQKDKTLKFK